MDLLVSEPELVGLHNCKVVSCERHKLLLWLLLRVPRVLLLHLMLRIKVLGLLVALEVLLSEIVVLVIEVVLVIVKTHLLELLLEVIKVALSHEVVLLHLRGRVEWLVVISLEIHLWLRLELLPLLRRLLVWVHVELGAHLHHVWSSLERRLLLVHYLGRMDLAQMVQRLLCVPKDHLSGLFKTHNLHFDDFTD